MLALRDGAGPDVACHLLPADLRDVLEVIPDLGTDGLLQKGHFVLAPFANDWKEQRLYGQFCLSALWKNLCSALSA